MKDQTKITRSKPVIENRPTHPTAHILYDVKTLERIRIAKTRTRASNLKNQYQKTNPEKSTDILPENEYVKLCIRRTNTITNP